MSENEPFSMGSTWREVLPAELFDIPSRSPVARMEARDILRRIATLPNVARLLLNAATEMPFAEREQAADMTEGIYYARIMTAQRWAKKVATSGVWRRPPMPDLSTPKLRKKKR